MTDPQGAVQALLDHLVESDVERGLQVAIYYQGELIVDAWAGLADAATGRPVDGETLFGVFSAGKGVVATTVHRLAERGLLDYDAPVAAYWPEFGRHGKERITLRHVLTHRAGVPQLPPEIDVTAACDWRRVVAAIAEERPLWEPGTATGYHAYTFGWILGEVVQRVSGRPFVEVVAEEVCRPLGITSLYFGIPDAVEPRVATIERPLPPPPVSPTGLLGTVRTGPLNPQEESLPINRPEVRRACVPAAYGLMNARALARHYAALLGEVGGVRLLPEARMRLASAPAPEPIAQAFGERAWWGMGYRIGRSLLGPGEPLTSFGHTGAGGTLGFADPLHRFALGLTKTRQVFGPHQDGAAARVTRAVRQALGISLP